MSQYDRPSKKYMKLPVYSLVCPFCDEPAYPSSSQRRIATNYRIYTLRKCEMGHEFYSVEEIPENQAEIAKEVKEIKHERHLERKRRKEESIE